MLAEKQKKPQALNHPRGTEGGERLGRLFL
jgi:hypothetical protein